MVAVATAAKTKRCEFDPRLYYGVYGRRNDRMRILPEDLSWTVILS